MLYKVPEYDKEAEGYFVPCVCADYEITVFQTKITSHKVDYLCEGDTQQDVEETIVRAKEDARATLEQHLRNCNIPEGATLYIDQTIYIHDPYGDHYCDSDEMEFKYKNKKLEVVL